MVTNEIVGCAGSASVNTRHPKSQSERSIMSRFALGTVQFGMPYGVANSNGQVSLVETRRVLDFATRQGIDTLDTAIAYGDSEKRLGEVGVSDWQIVSKLPPLPSGCNDVQNWIESSVLGVLDRLRVSQLSALLLHKPDQLLEPHGDALYAALQRIKSEGLLKKIGVSVYGPEELVPLEKNFSFDIIQAPFNALDRRLATSGCLSRLRAKGVEVHVRSVFLQGLLLMADDERPRKFDRWQKLWDKWHDWLFDCQISPLQAALAVVLAEEKIDRIVVGVDNVIQLEEIVKAAEKVVPVAPIDLCCEEMDLINPSRWALLN